MAAVCCASSVLMCSGVVSVQLRELSSLVEVELSALTNTMASSQDDEGL